MTKQPKKCPRCGACYKEDPSCGKTIHDSLPSKLRELAAKTIKKWGVKKVRSALAEIAAEDIVGSYGKDDLRAELLDWVLDGGVGIRQMNKDQLAVALAEEWSLVTIEEGGSIEKEVENWEDAWLSLSND